MLREIFLLDEPTITPEPSLDKERLGIPITISSTESTATIVYTLDGSTPVFEPGCNIYDGRLFITEDNTTVSAIAVADGYLQSNVASKTFRIKTVSEEIEAIPNESDPNFDNYVERIKIRYEKLSNNDKAIINPANVQRLNDAYAILLEHLNYKNEYVVNNIGTKMEVIGFVEKVEKTRPAGASIIVLNVNEQPNTEALLNSDFEVLEKYNISIVEELVSDGSEVGEVQPLAEDELTYGTFPGVLVKLKVDKDIYDKTKSTSNIKLYHKNGGNLEEVDYWTEYTNGNSYGYIIFIAESFSDYILALKKESKPTNTSHTASTSVSVITNSSTHVAYMSGYSDGTFRPNDNITRAEISTILSKINIKYNNYEQYNHKFSDVAVSSWYSNYVGFSYKNGSLVGMPDGTFKPNAYTKRSEFISAMVRNFKLDYTGKKSSFKDAKGRWFEPYMAALEERNIITGLPDGTSGADKYITRAEAVVIINKLLNRIPNKAKIDTQVLQKTFNDVTKERWYYYDVIEATNQHRVTIYH